MTKTNNNRADRGKNKKAGNEAKLTPEQERVLLAKSLRLKPKTKQFIDELLNNPKISQTEAYIRTHRTENRSTAGSRASELVKKRSVQIYSNATVGRAKKRIASLIDTTNESIALKASQDILDRTEGKAIQKTETTSKVVEVKLDLSGVRIGAHYLRPEDITPILE